MQFSVERLGPARYPTPCPSNSYVTDCDRITYHSEMTLIRQAFERGEEPPSFERSGPHEQLFFDPHAVTCALATCGGLCPGLNDVIRGLVLAMHHLYGVRRVFGVPNGYQGLVPPFDEDWLELTPKTVAGIHLNGGTVLGSSRGAQDIAAVADTLVRHAVDVLFLIGGDGTLRGAGRIQKELARRGLPISVIGLPKTIDNDIALIERSFGFETAVEASRAAISAAHTEALGYHFGIGVVKLMGRHSGFLAAHAALSTGDVNICLVPEVPFVLEQGEFGFLPALKRRLCARGHAVVLVAEGAAQELIAAHGEPCYDASGNLVLADVGIFLREQIAAYFKRHKIAVSLKYIDPSYMIRSLPADPSDSAFCLMLAHHAVHAAMAGRTGAVVGYWNQHFTLVPIEAAVAERKRIDRQGRLWQSVLQSTGQGPM